VYLILATNEQQDSKRPRFEVLTATVISTAVFWIATPCSFVVVTNVSEEHFSITIEHHVEFCANNNQK
jgi:hypothetical protein